MAKASWNSSESRSETAMVICSTSLVSRDMRAADGRFW